MNPRTWFLAGALALVALTLDGKAALAAEPPPTRSYDAEITRRAKAAEADVIAWRRDFHQNPELSNREERTARIVAERLRALGLEVKTGVARHGVVALLRGGKPGPVVALRADMDALPVTEAVDLPFASKARGTYQGKDVGVMHACGHDAHTAMLLGTATVLSGMKADVPGTVKFIFQPAEEGPPVGEEGGAPLMIAEGVLRDPAPAAIFGLHVTNIDYGTLGYKPEGMLAASDYLRFAVVGKQAHGGRPWEGIDPIVVASQIVMGLQTVVSRQSDPTTAPAVLTIGSFHGGVRNNIVPDSVAMEGTLRTYDSAMRRDLLARIERTAKSIAAGSGATATFAVVDSNPVTWNDAALTARMAPSLARVVEPKQVRVMRARTGAEDFAWYAQKVPGFYIFLGSNPPGMEEKGSPPNHSPKFFVDESTLVLGVRAMSTLAMDFLSGGGTATGASASP
jgi:amidohydrolase